MKITLTNLRNRSLFLSFVMSMAILLAFFAGKLWLAEHWSSSENPQRWVAAAHLEPGNAETWSQLGLSEEWNAGPGDLPQGVRYLRRAAETDPLSASLWMELASAYESSSDPNRARVSYERAQKDFPISPEVAWRYGSFLLYRGNHPDGYAQIKRALLVDPSLTSSAVSECWQVDPSAAQLLDKVLPSRSAYYLPAIDFFLSEGLLDPALEVWRRQIALHLPLKMTEAIPLVDALIGQNRTAEAQRTWQQALRLTNWPQSPSPGHSLVFNGGFEDPVAGGGFGWRETEVKGARFTPDQHVSHSGSFALRIDFDGTANLNFQDLVQYVPVQPRTRYHFSAYLRTEEISTDSGIHFQMDDPDHPSQPSILTPDLRGTNPWTLVETNFLTGPETRLVRILLRREPSWKFDNLLRGTVWADDVALTPIPPLDGGSP